MSNLLKNPITVSMDSIVETMKNCLYLEGNPRQYRANAKEGIFNLEGNQPLGNRASLHVLAFRIFEDVLFGKPNVWAEVFFIDEQGKLSSMLFNSYSAKNFQDYQRKLFYESVPIEQVVTDISWVGKTVVLDDGKKANYHIAQFSVQEVLEAEVCEVVSEFTRRNKVYREATAPHAQGDLTGYKLVTERNYPAVSQAQIPAPSEEETDEESAAKLPPNATAQAPGAQGRKKTATQQVDELPY